MVMGAKCTSHNDKIPHKEDLLILSLAFGWRECKSPQYQMALKNNYPAFID